MGEDVNPAAGPLPLPENLQQYIDAMDRRPGTAVYPVPGPQASARQVGGVHYVGLAVQPWAAMEAWMSRQQFVGYLRGNVIKYVARCDAKGGLEDLRKARHYLDRLIELEAQPSTPSKQAEGMA